MTHPSENVADLPIASFRSDGIDAVRGVLAFWVLLAHLVSWAAVLGRGNEVLSRVFGLLALVFQQGGETHPAVLGFIVLSGYCIHRNGFRRRGGIGVRSYAIRRFFRIWPIYLLATFVGVVGFTVVSQWSPEAARSLSGTESISPACIAAKLSGVSVVLPSLHACSFQGNAPLVTAMVEEWLYVLYAVIFHFVLLRGKQRAFGVAVVAAWMAGVALSTGDAVRESWWHNGSVLGFLPYWWLGVAFLDARFRERVCAYRWVVGAVWLGLTTFLLITGIRSLALFEVRKFSLALLFGVLFVSLDTPLRSPMRRVVAAAGRAGYSVYALHAPLLILLLIWGANWWQTLAVVTALTLVVHRFYEKPLIDVGKRLAGPAPIAPAEAASA